jgi:hypothetical protein
MSHVSYACWAVVALLALAAGYNHRWHHTRDNHPATRFTRPTQPLHGSDVPAAERVRSGSEATR